jgi:predicted nucleic acid-binding protein
MLLGACLEAGVTTLYTEDMGSPRQIDSIRLVNPLV